MTVAEFLQAHGPTLRRTVASETARQYMTILNSLAVHFGQRPMSSVDVVTVEQLGASLKADGWLGRPLEPATVGLYLTRYAALWDAALERGLVTTNPFRSVLTPRRVSVRGRLNKLHPEAAERIVDAAAVVGGLLFRQDNGAGASRLPHAAMVLQAELAGAGVDCDGLASRWHR